MGPARIRLPRKQQRSRAPRNHRAEIAKDRLHIPDRFLQPEIIEPILLPTFQPDCAFCQITAGSLPASIVMQDDEALAFLDSRPLFPGHCLLVPKAHIETLADLPAASLGSFFSAVQLLSQAVQDASEAEGSFVAINNRVSQSVPHLHVHIVPRRKRDGLRGFFWPRGKYADDAQMEAVQSSIRKAVERLQSVPNRGGQGAVRNL
ncbi:MAG: HIT family protein [Acidobacteriia bacterium]|nr:HIT family protein [Terriglobia bacterium]